MTKLTFVTLALVAAAAYSAQASAASNNAAMRRAHAQATTPVSSKTTDCVRAPNVGSFATAPFTEPPCMPGTMR
ncbi:hypothetical protein JQ616_15885 [Bradyrhizobium tropiciagri]|uniref:hypothetical protein n=1 Tax=Bradyrhizobium tropiciagri TaxID=312253 RepID=UPI001BAAEAD6|nr:hypothetical protein [Bradyrhizobium tropiciagri]MBR0896441.1 hypothetical protein [Bradyrhizobium tropiciagri]